MTSSTTEAKGTPQAAPPLAYPGILPEFPISSLRDREPAVVSGHITAGPRVSCAFVTKVSSGRGRFPARSSQVGLFGQELGDAAAAIHVVGAAEIGRRDWDQPVDGEFRRTNLALHDDRGMQVEKAEVLCISRYHELYRLRPETHIAIEVEHGLLGVHEAPVEPSVAVLQGEPARGTADRDPA